MKNLSSLIALLPLLLPTLAQAQTPAPKLITLRPEIIFTPKGYDSNDSVQLVVYGKFHDVCHKMAPTEFTVDQANHKIVVTNRAYETSKICTEMYVTTPYSSVLNLGMLASGTYEVFAQDSGRNLVSMAKLPVAVARSSNGDNFLYAQVEVIQFNRTSDAHSPELVLTGNIGNTCLKLKEVQVKLAAGNVYDVLPIMSKVTGANCEMKDTPYTAKVTLANFPSEATLLNVRSLEGQSIERVISPAALFIPKQ